jgi:hypothetical protein
MFDVELIKKILILIVLDVRPINFTRKPSLGVALYLYFTKIKQLKFRYF